MTSPSQSAQRLSFASQALRATQTAHFISAATIRGGYVITIALTGLCLIPTAVMTLAYLGGVVQFAQLAALKTALVFVASKGALCMAGITWIFYVTHLALFSRHFITVRKLQTMIEKQTGQQLQVDWFELGMLFSGIVHLIVESPKREPLGHLSYRSFQFRSREPFALIYVTEDESGTHEQAVYQSDFDAINAFIDSFSQLKNNEEYNRLYKKAKNSINDVV